jgi:signal transduction histidine kinase
MYLASKEAVHNIIRHAQATSVTIHIAATQELQILVQDNGIGLNSNHTRFGNGMKNMQHRMEQLKGSFTAQSGKGTCITLRAPLPVV